MDPKDIAAFLAAIAWPLIVAALVLMFRAPIFLLFSRLAESLVVKTIKLKVLSVEVELTPEQAKALWMNY